MIKEKRGCRLEKGCRLVDGLSNIGRQVYEELDRGSSHRFPYRSFSVFV